jgi:GpV Apex motif
MDGTTVKTNMTIKARDFVTNAGVSLSSHTHSGVRVGPSNTGTPV